MGVAFLPLPTSVQGQERGQERREGPGSQRGSLAGWGDACTRGALGPECSMGDGKGGRNLNSVEDGSPNPFSDQEGLYFTLSE